jgi:hypothetical protein
LGGFWWTTKRGKRVSKTLESTFDPHSKEIKINISQNLSGLNKTVLLVTHKAILLSESIF